MKISIISNYTFASSLPDDLTAVHQYGSESMSALLAEKLAQHHQIEFHAPVGSSHVGHYHPLRRTDGKYLASDSLDDISLDGSRHTDLIDSFLIDCTPWSNTTEQLALYNDYRNYLCYRLGYRDYDYPRLQKQNHITHCQHFADLFEKAGHSGCQVAHFGISDFWNNNIEVSEDFKYRPGIFEGLRRKEYYLFPHRYNPEKGSFDVIRLAKAYPEKTFVFSSAAVSPDHIAYLQTLQTQAPPNCKFVQLPSTPDREYYRRELYRNAICTLSPFHNINDYHDTGGILSMESIKCGTPVICTRSPGSEEILGHQQDSGVFFIDGYESLKLIIRYVDFQSAKPAPWKWTTEQYVNEYMQAIQNIIN